MRVLSVTHGPSVLGGVFDETVEHEGHVLERWSVPLGGAPQPAAGYDAVMVFGGAMHPDQDEEFPWLAREATFLEGAFAAGVPTVGVCLGAQMIARAAGSWIGPAESPEIGWFDVELTPDGRDDPVLGVLGQRTTALQWHHYTFGIPEGGVELARSAVCSQAFRIGNAWAVQFHAEVTRAMVEAWIAEDGHELAMPSAELLAETRARISVWNEQGRALCSAFLGAAA